MCTYSDSVGTPPKSAAEVGDFFVNPGTGGAADYWADQSFGAISLSGSSVHGWYRSTMSLTTSQDPNTQRWQRIAGCVDAARADARDPYTAPAGTRTVVYMDKCVDSGFQGSVLMDPCAPWLAFAAHEMGHGYSLDHSFSNRSTDAEYDDPWDIMSAMNVHWFDGVYPRSGPGLVADQRDRLGWIGRSKVTTFGADGATDATVLVAPLDSPSAGGSQLIRVPYDPANARRYYTVELDAKRGWDRGIYADTVLIHKLRDDHQPALLRDFQTEAAFPTQHLRDAANDVTIDVVSTSSSGAVVRIHSGLPGRCRQGFV